MICEIKQEIVNRLEELYPNHYIYDEDVPQKFKTPSFMIHLILQDYEKRMNAKYKSQLNFDVAFFSDKDDTEIKEDCLKVQENLFRNFDFLKTVRVLNKQAEITDNVLHFSFEVGYSEMIDKPETKMETHELNTNI